MSDQFATDCEAAAKGLRRVPKELRRALSTEVKAAVADPLAARIRAAASGPYARILGPGTKARAGADPTIVVGGASPKLSGGAGPRRVVFGTEWGGGKRLSPVVGYDRGGRRKGHVRGYRRYSTNQFHRHQHPFVFPTVNANMDKALEAWATIVTDVVNREVP